MDLVLEHLTSQLEMLRSHNTRDKEELDRVNADRQAVVDRIQRRTLEIDQTRDAIVRLKNG